MQYNMVHHCLFKYEIFPFQYIRVHESTSLVYLFCSSLLQQCSSIPGWRARLKAAESQQLKGTQVQAESIESLAQSLALPARRAGFFAAAATAASAASASAAAASAGGGAGAAGGG
jgi:hypothetical protein